MSILNILNYVPVFLCLTGLMSEGCGQSPTPAELAAAPVITQDANPITIPADPETVDPVSEPLPPPPVGVSTFSLTYYRAAKTVAPITGWSTKTYTAVGSCVVYNANTYCWDDGVKTLTWNSNNLQYGPYTYSYFGLGIDSMNRLDICNGGCPVNDAMIAPRIVSGSIGTQFKDDSTVKTGFNAVMAGTGVPVTCFEDSRTLNCGDFTVDLNQAVIY